VQLLSIAIRVQSRAREIGEVRARDKNVRDGTIASLAAHRDVTRKMGATLSKLWSSMRAALTGATVISGRKNTQHRQQASGQQKDTGSSTSTPRTTINSSSNMSGIKKYEITEVCVTSDSISFIWAGIEGYLGCPAEVIRATEQYKTP